jgi:gamma-glutamylaminecyclotransferase
VSPEVCPAHAFQLFVYGTLKRGGCRHGLLAGQRFLGEARTAPRYALLDLGDFPGLVRDEAGGHAVHGELYEVEASPLALLDREEGAPELFRRELVEVDGRSGPIQAYFYQHPGSGWPRCPAGRWGGEGR